MDEQASSDRGGEPLGEPPRDPRTNMFIAAKLEWGAASVAVTVRNLSASGALVEGVALPPPETAVRLVRGSLDAAGTVAWLRQQRCGLRLTDPVPVALWMARPGNLGQAGIDAAVRLIKTGGPLVADTFAAPAVPPDLAKSTRKLEALLAAVSDDLASDSATVARHAEQLQQLDLLAQGLARLRQRLEEASRARCSGAAR